MITIAIKTNSDHISLAEAWTKLDNTEYYTILEQPKQSWHFNNKLVDAVPIVLTLTQTKTD